MQRLEQGADRDLSLNLVKKSRLSLADLPTQLDIACRSVGRSNRATKALALVSHSTHSSLDGTTLLFRL